MKFYQTIFLEPPLPNVSNLDEDKGFFQLSSPCNLTVLKFLNNKVLPCDRPLEPPLPDVSHLDEEEFSKKRWCIHALLRFNCTKSIALQLKNFCPLNKIWRGFVEKLYTKIATVMEFRQENWERFRVLEYASSKSLHQSFRVSWVLSAFGAWKLWKFKNHKVFSVFESLEIFGGQWPMDCSITS